MPTQRIFAPFSPQCQLAELAKAADAHLVLRVGHVFFVQYLLASVVDAEGDGRVGIDDVVLHGGAELSGSGALGNSHF